jgi:hypothetical protein
MDLVTDEEDNDEVDDDDTIKVVTGAVLAPAVVPAVLGRPTYEAIYKMKEAMPVPAIPRKLRIKGREVVVSRVGEDRFVPALRFKSMAACCRHFGLWPNGPDGKPKKTINTTDTFKRWIKQGKGTIVAELGDPFGGPYFTEGARVPVRGAVAPAAPVVPLPAVPHVPTPAAAVQ